MESNTGVLTAMLNVNNYDMFVAKSLRIDMSFVIAQYCDNIYYILWKAFSVNDTATIQCEDCKLSN